MSPVLPWVLASQILMATTFVYSSKWSSDMNLFYALGDPGVFLRKVMCRNAEAVGGALGGVPGFAPWIPCFLSPARQGWAPRSWCTHWASAALWAYFRMISSLQRQSVPGAGESETWSCFCLSFVFTSLFPHFLNMFEIYVSTYNLGLLVINTCLFPAVQQTQGRISPRKSNPRPPMAKPGQSGGPAAVQLSEAGFGRPHLAREKRLHRYMGVSINAGTRVPQ